MRSFLSSIVLFFLLYLPASALIGLGIGAFQAPSHTRSMSYELFLWFVVSVQLLLPTLVAYLLTLVVVKHVVWPRLESYPVKRFISIASFSVVLPTTQALVWGGNHLSIIWVLVAVLPAALVGFVLTINRDRSRLVST